MTGFICMGELIYIMHFTKLSLLNRLFFTGILVTGTYYWSKHVAYRTIIEDQAEQLTLTGQEARI